VRAALIALAVVAFLAVSALVGRWLTTDNAERTQITRLLEAQARGDVPGMLGELESCSGACAAQARANARRLRRPGDVQIVSYESETSHALSGRSGPTRVVWKTPTTLTVVQCVAVQRTGNVLGGLDVHLQAIGPSKPRTAGC
jgi:hypothetical protein